MARQYQSKIELCDRLNGDESELDISFSSNSDESESEYCPKSDDSDEENIPPTRKSTRISTTIKRISDVDDSRAILGSIASTEPTKPVEPPSHYFEKYLPNEVFEQFALMTNRHAYQNPSKIGFVQTYTDEIKQLFALHILMGCNKMSRLRNYWNRRMGPAVFQDSTTMTPKRFCQLRNNLHIVDNLKKPADCADKFYKVYLNIRKLLSIHRF
jgi:Transposase IS4